MPKKIKKQIFEVVKDEVVKPEMAPLDYVGMG